jgi:hypothetical protein
MRVATMALALAVPAVNAARGAGPVVGWGAGAPPPMIGASAIAVGSFHSCAVQAGTGAVVCWGENFFGEATPPASVNGTAGYIYMVVLLDTGPSRIGPRPSRPSRGFRSLDPHAGPLSRVSEGLDSYWLALLTNG